MGRILGAALLVALLGGCAARPLTKRDVANVKADSVLIYRYTKKDGKSWYYADRITRVDGETLFYNTSPREANTPQSTALEEFLKEKEYSMPRSDLTRLMTEQGDDKKILVEVR